MAKSSTCKLVVGLLAAMAGTGAYAVQCDLTGGIGSPSCTINGAIYENPDNSVNVGSGLVNPFLTVQKTPSESGFSTDAASNNLPLDVKRAEGNGQFTRTFTLGDLGTVNVSGTDYFQFFLDLNEPGSTNQSQITLDLLQIYNANNNSTDLGTGTTLADLGVLFGTPLYDLDAGGDNNILLDFLVFGKGSGQGIDMDVLIPVSLFGGVDAADKIVFATAFGNTEPSQDGFEEWWYLSGGNNGVCPPGTVGTPPDCVIPPSGIPEPATLALLGLGLAGLAAARRKSL